MINFGGLNLKFYSDFGYFNIYEQLWFHAQLSWAWKKIYNFPASTQNTIVLKIP